MKVLVASVSDMCRDPRPRRMVEALADVHSVAALALHPPPVEGVEFVRLPLARRSRERYMRILAALAFSRSKSHLGLSKRGEKEVRDAVSRLAPDVIVCHDLNLLPLLFSCRGRAAVICDAREFYPRQYEDQWLWRVLFMRRNARLCRTYLPRVDFAWTVSKGLARAYAEEFGVTMDVLYSLPAPVNVAPGEVRDACIRLVHHGNASQSRTLETLIKAMDFTDERFELDLYLVGKGAYYDALGRLASERQRVRILPPVPFGDIVAVLNRYDMGLCVYPPVSFNVKHCMPNKIFEFIQARLGVVVGPSPDLAGFVRAEGVGVVTGGFAPQQLAEQLNVLSAAQIQAFKQRSHVAAGVWNAVANQEKIREAVAKVVGHR